MLSPTAIVAARSLARALVEDGLFDGLTMRRVFEQWLEDGDVDDRGLEGYLLEHKLIAARVLKAVLRAHGWAGESSSGLGSSCDPLGLEETHASRDVPPPQGEEPWAERRGVWPTVPPGTRWGQVAREGSPSERLPQQQVSERLPQQQVSDRLPQQVSDRLPQQQVSDRLPQQQVSDRLPQQVVSERLPQQVQSEAPTRRLPKQTPSRNRALRTFKEPRVGQILGGYELVEELGRGGMGIVFEARRDDDARRYAVKVLKPSQSPAFKAHRKRFQREIELLRKLKHPNLIRIRARGRAGEYDWYAMDHVAGPDLHRLRSEQELDLERKLQIFEDVCRGAAYAHDHGIVHRDLKPHNVIVEEREGRAVLIDFGLAKLSASDDPRLTRSGALLGTPYYMSPEQIRNPHGVDHRTDVWALGVILYELLTGQVPFPGTVPGDVCQRILHAEPVRPRKLNPAVSADLEGILLCALEKEPNRRYPSAKQLLAELARLRHGRAVSHDGMRGRARRWLSRHREGFLAGLLVASAGWGLAWLLSSAL